MEVIDIVAEYLKENGYDGLFSQGECACMLDDLMPCGDIQHDCTAGYVGPPGEHEGDWAMYASKEDAALQKQDEVLEEVMPEKKNNTG